MNSKYIIKPIAHIYTDFNERFGIPRQAGLIDDLTAKIVFEEEFRDINSVRGIEGFSHLWLIWHFSETAIDMASEPVKWSPTVSPPRLGGKTKIGVFATRAPYRPNSLGLSSVKLISVELDKHLGPVLTVAGADILNGTGIFDIKPYIPYSDCHTDASGGFSVSEKQTLTVCFPDELLSSIPKEKQNALISILQLDPRGAYEKQPGFRYGLSFSDYDIRFTVENDILTVFDVSRKSSSGKTFTKIK